jgi:hypothetical protein
MINHNIKEGAVNYNHPYFWSAFVLISNSLYSNVSFAQDIKPKRWQSFALPSFEF